MTKLTPPNWAPNAVPTPRGWVILNKPGKLGNPELVHSMKISQSDIDEFFSVNEVDEASDALLLTEAPRGHTSLNDMSDEEREALNETNKSFFGSFLKG